MLMYGRDPILPLDTLLEPRRRYYGDEYVPTMLQRLQTAFAHVAINTKKAREYIKRQADKKARQRLFNEGDPVFLHDPCIKEGQMKKLSSPWRSHYRIVEMITPVTALIRNQKSGGHIVSPKGLRPNPEKVRAIQTLDAPTTVKGVRSYLGLAGYYRNFIPKFSSISRPLTKLTRKNTRFYWDDDCQDAFDYFKKALTEAPILGYPDVTKPYSLYTDASDYSVGGILTQDTPVGEKVICYVSHQLTSSRLRYPVIEKECFAIIYCLTKLRQYLLGADVTVYTDHKPLKSLFTAEMKNTRVQRWAILLDEYQVKIKYRQGIHNGRADMLSRIRVEPTQHEIKESNDIVAVDASIDKIITRFNGHNHNLFDQNINMTEYQDNDDHCLNIKTQLNKGGNEKISSEYVIQDNILYHVGKENRFETDPFLQLVIPLKLVNTALECFHDDLGGGHVGLEKTYQKIRSKYFWINCSKM